MEIYLIDKETNEVKAIYNNVINWRANFIIYNNNGNIGKTYCDAQTEYFSDKI